MSVFPELPENTMATLSFASGAFTLYLPLRLGLPTPDADLVEMIGEANIETPPWKLALGLHLLAYEHRSEDSGWTISIETRTGSGRGQAEALDKLAGPTVQEERRKLAARVRSRTVPVSWEDAQAKFWLERDELTQLRDRLLEELYSRELVYVGFDRFNRLSSTD